LSLTWPFHGSGPLRAPNGPGTLGDAPVQVRRLVCKWTTGVVKTSSHSSHHTTWPQTLWKGPLGRNWLYLPLQKIWFFFRKLLGFRVCLLPIYSIP
jgi:hypothetical protein